MRRPTRSPRRFKPHHDEYVPSLEALQGWNACESIPVLVKEVYGKGLGVVARRALPANRVVARYEFRVVLRARARVAFTHEADTFDRDQLARCETTALLTCYRCPHSVCRLSYERVT